MTSLPPLIDISRPLHGRTPVWPGDAPVQLGWTARREAGAAANVGELRASTHAGTHADAPFHVAGEGARIGAAPLPAFLGPATVVDARGRETIDLDFVEEVLALGALERVLFHTGCWTDPEVLPLHFPALRPGAAERLGAAGVLLVGTDAPSVDPPDSETLPAHRVLAAAGIAILENLLLDHVPPGAYELIALPLRLPEADASPVRAVLRPR